MVNRDRHEIVTDILENAKTGKKKTELMRDVGLSYVQAKQYLNIMLDKGLLQTNEKNFLKTTKKGTEFLEKCAECALDKWYKQKERKPPHK